ncbi:nuclear transport factor 2-like protein [Motilibacter aurantiacus]|uniref:hypothetical protein n=1 Tax=Motilibacter aurantiacus TaxID=2714955 RepID=UPI001E3D57B6|nr:hypothetical protein [Motilibacter aurantiacus]
MTQVSGGEQRRRRALVQEAVDIETRAWDTQDVDLLLDLFHPDMVWPFPPDPSAHDPLTWVWVNGRFDRDRWGADYRELFAAHQLVHNRRVTAGISLSPQFDAALAVVDVDTLWEHRATGARMHWKGRAGKGYSWCQERWLLVMHHGLLDY